jgi:NAD(P)-dependent dehydrogenase (short-subunit alcohol dehydrogenase family)
MCVAPVGVAAERRAGRRMQRYGARLAELGQPDRQHAVETEGVHSLGVIGSEFEQQMVARTPLGRLGQPEDIASVAVFLASAASAWMTGETISVGGGFS